MMTAPSSLRRQGGYFLILAVILIMVIAVMGAIIAYTYSNRAKMSVAQQQGLQAFYIAEAGLEVASRLLVGTNLVSGQERSCNTLDGYSLVTNATMLGGTFTATAVGGALYSASTTLSGAITSTANSLTLASITGLAAHGRIRIDNEAIDYASISGSTLIGLNRGAAGTTASSHSSGAVVSESVCLVNVQAGIPSIASPKYKRELEMAVEIITASDVWAVGNRSGNNFSIIRWNSPSAGVWNNYSFTDTSNRANLNAVSHSSTTNGWAVGDRQGSNFTFVNWNGTSWSAAPLAGSCSGQHLEGVATISASEAWAVGVRYRPACAGSGNFRYTVLKWNGSAWTLLTPSSSPAIPADASGLQNLNAISMIDTNDDGFADYGFAVGNSGNILRYTGSAWVTDSSGSTNLFGVDIVSATEAWAVGASGRILKWNGSTWSIVTSPTSNQLNAVSMIDTDGDGAANYGWASGNSGVIIYYNGSTWSSQTSGVGNNLLGIGAVSSSSAWAVGGSSTIREWNGTSWSANTSPITAINGIGVVSGASTVSGSLVGSWQQVFH